MIRFKDLFGKGSHPKSITVYYVVGIIFIVTAFVIGVSNNPPGIILLLLGIFMLVFGIMKFRGRK